MTLKVLTPDQTDPFVEDGFPVLREVCVYDSVYRVRDPGASDYRVFACPPVDTVCAAWTRPADRPRPGFSSAESALVFSHHSHTADDRIRLLLAGSGVRVSAGLRKEFDTISRRHYDGRFATLQLAGEEPL